MWDRVVCGSGLGGFSATWSDCYDQTGVQLNGKGNGQSRMTQILSD